MLLHAVIGRLRSSKTSRTGPGPYGLTGFLAFSFLVSSVTAWNHRSMNRPFLPLFFLLELFLFFCFFSVEISSITKYRSLYIGNWKFPVFELFEIFRRWYYYRFGIFSALIMELYHCYSYAWKVLIYFFAIVFPKKRNKLNLTTCIGLSDFA